jgi:hypothetical protein
VATLDQLDTARGDELVWPPEGHADRIAAQLDYARLYRNRRDEILQFWSADLLRFVGIEANLIPYPAAKIVARTVAAFLFGEDPTIEHESDDVTDLLERMSAETSLPSRLLEGAITQAVEGEVYLRPAWDRDLLDVPIPTIIAGSRVIPTFRFGLLADAAIVTTYIDQQGATYWRLIEQHEPGLIRNALFRGTADRIGTRVPLDRRPETAELLDELDTGVDDLLLTHIPYFRDASSAHGVSMLDGVVSMLIGLHRLYSQEQSDAELARRRVAMPATYIGRDQAGRPTWDRDVDLLVLSDDAVPPVGSQAPPPIIPIEFDDDLVLRDRIRGRFEDVLIACGISPQSLMPDDAGGAISGTSRKLAQSLTIRTVAASARYWQDGIARFAGRSIDVSNAQLGTSVDYGDQLPTVKLADGLIDDPAELARIVLDLDSAEAISTYQKVRRTNPEWTEAQVLAEVDAILEERPAPPPPPQLDAFGGADQDDDGADTELDDADGADEIDGT